MFGNSSDGSASRADAPAGVEGVLGEVSEAELDAFVSKLRTDKNRIIPPAEARPSRPEWESERLHGSRRPLISCLPEEAAERHAWFVELDGKRSGPHEVSVLKAYWEQGELGPDSLCWREGFRTWAPVCQVPALALALAPLPQDWLPDSLEALDALDARVEPVPDGAQAPDFVLKGADALRFLAGDVLEPEPVTQVPLPAAPEPVAVEPVRTHAVVPLPVVAPAPVSRREERGERGLWLALVGGVMGGVTVALTLVLLMGWGGRAPLSRLFSAAGADAASSSAAPGASSAVGASVASAPGGAAAGSGTASTAVPGPGGTASARVPGAGGTASVLVQGLIGAAPANASGPGGTGVAFTPVPDLAGVGTAAGPSGMGLGSAPLTGRGGAVPVLSAAGGAVASSAAPTAPPSAPLETASLPARAPAPRPKVPAAALALEKRSAETPPAPQEISFPEPAAEAAAAPEEEEEELDLGPDEDFERELAEPPAGLKAAKGAGERTVFVPPAPGQPPVSLAQSDVFEVVLANKGDITACASAQAQKDAGRVVVRWSILPSGKVDDVVMETAPVKGTPLADCIEAKIRTWTFPKHQEQGAPVRFPFVF